MKKKIISIFLVSVLLIGFSTISAKEIENNLKDGNVIIKTQKKGGEGVQIQETWMFFTKITGTVNNLVRDDLYLFGLPFFSNTKTIVFLGAFWINDATEGYFDITPMFQPAMRVYAGIDFDELIILFFNSNGGSGFTLTPSGDQYTLSIDGYSILTGIYKIPEVCDNSKNENRNNSFTLRNLS